MIDDQKTLEHSTVTAPFGVRFWDSVTQKTVGNGFSVFAYPANRKDRRVAAFSSPSGAYAFRGLPGLREFELGAGDSEFWSSIPSREFVIEVEDTLRRFLPFCFRVSLPVRGAFNWEDSLLSSAENPVGVPLFSAPARTPPASVAVLRALLLDPGLKDRDHERGKPAAWAEVRATIGDRSVRGIADKRGQLLMMFPYPPPSVDLSDPPALHEQTWTIELEAWYRRNAEPPSFPDLAEILDQPAGVLWSDDECTMELPALELKYAQQLVLRSTGSGGEALSELFITSVD
jgi:hypothetical protein